MTQKTTLTPAAALQLVTFEVGDEEFAIDILRVKEINRMMEITRVPQSPAGVEGVVNLRGTIVPIVDLRKRFGCELNLNVSSEADEPQHTRSSPHHLKRIIVVEVGGRSLGFIVDRVNQPLHLSASAVEPAPRMVCSIDSSFITGIGRLDDPHPRLLILLDVDRLFGEVGTTNARADGARMASPIKPSVRV